MAYIENDHCKYFLGSNFDSYISFDNFFELKFRFGYFENPSNLHFNQFKVYDFIFLLKNYLFGLGYSN